MSKNPEDKTLAAVLQKAIESQLYDVHVTLPCKIVSYNVITQNASIQPLLKRKYKTGRTVNLPQIQDVPVQWPSGNSGKSYIHIPLIVGDLGVAIFSERSLDLWLAGVGVAVSPEDTRHHHIADAIFIPGIRPFKVAITDASATNMVVQHDKMRIEMDPAGKISIGGVQEELLTIIDSLISTLEGALVATDDGPRPFTPSTITALDGIQTRLAEIKRI